MPLTLESRTRRMQVFHVPHAVGCQERCICAEQVVVTTVEHPRTGERAQRHHRKMMPGSITFLALERQAGLPSALLGVAEIKVAIDRGYLRVVEQTPELRADAAAPAAPPEAMAPPTPAASEPLAVSAVSEPPPAAAPAPAQAVKATSFVPGSPAVARKEPS